MTQRATALHQRVEASGAVVGWMVARAAPRRQLVELRPPEGVLAALALVEPQMVA